MTTTLAGSAPSHTPLGEGDELVSTQAHCSSPVAWTRALTGTYTGAEPTTATMTPAATTTTFRSFSLRWGRKYDFTRVSSAVLQHWGTGIHGVQYKRIFSFTPKVQVPYSCVPNDTISVKWTMSWQVLHRQLTNPFSCCSRWMCVMAAQIHYYWFKNLKEIIICQCQPDITILQLISSTNWPLAPDAPDFTH